MQASELLVPAATDGGGDLAQLREADLEKIRSLNGPWASSDVNGAVGVGLIVVQCRGQRAVAQGEQAGDKFNRTRAGAQTAEITFWSKHRQLRSPFAEDLGQALRFPGIVGDGAVTLSVDVIEISHRDAGLAQCPANGED